MMTIAQKQELILLNVPVRLQEEVKTFLNSIPKMKLLQPEGKPRKEWRMFYDETWSNARTMAWDAMRNPAYDSAWKNAVGAAYNIARSSGREDAMNEVTAFAERAARKLRLSMEGNIKYVIGTVEASAKLMAAMIIVKDLDFKRKKKYVRTAEAQIDVWQKGYALACEARRVLYVYCEREDAKGLLRS